MVGKQLHRIFSVIRHIYDLFITAADVVIAHPQNNTPIYAARDPPRSQDQTIQHKNITLAWKHPEHIQKDQGQFLGRLRFGNTKTWNIYDTPENQFAKSLILCTTIKRLETPVSHYQKPKTIKDSDVVDIVTTMVKGIDRRVSHTFFNNVSDSLMPQRRYLWPLPRLPDTANFANITSWCNTVYHWQWYFLVFPWKDVALLNEYWCFIKLNSILKERIIS